MGGIDLKKNICAWLLFAAGFLILIPSISAQETQEEESVLIEDTSDSLRLAEEAFVLGGGDSPSAAAAGESVWAVIRMLLVLIVTALAIYGIVYFIKKSAKPAAASDPFLKILATSHLGSNRYAHIVSVGEKAWLLGSSDGGVNLIGEIEDKDIINAMQLEESKKGPQGSGRFSDFVSALRNMGNQAGSRSSGADDIRKRRERLRQM